MTPWVQVWILKVTFPTVAFSNAVLFQKRYQDVWLPEHSKSFKYRYIILSGQNLCSMFRQIAVLWLMFGSIVITTFQTFQRWKKLWLPQTRRFDDLFLMSATQLRKMSAACSVLEDTGHITGLLQYGPCTWISMFRKFKPVPLVSLISSRQNCNFTKDFTFISSQYVSTSSALFTWWFW